MRSTFIQKVLICMIAGFFAACLIQWGKVFVEGDAVILSGAGSVRGYQVHQVSNRTFPSKNTFVKNPTAPADLPDAGTWIAADDPSVPEWLWPFGGEVLVAVDPATGEHLSGVGVKRHDAFGHELAVVTRPAAEGRGLGRRLVAQAARRVLDEGAVPTYLHAVDNHASAHLATAAGFPDLGWAVYGTG